MTSSTTHLGYTLSEREAILHEIGNLAIFLKGASESGATAAEILDELRVAMALRIGMVAEVITLDQAEHLMETFESPQELLNELKKLADEHYINQLFGG